LRKCGFADGPKAKAANAHLLECPNKQNPKNMVARMRNCAFACAGEISLGGLNEYGILYLFIRAIAQIHICSNPYLRFS
jgi:hypothetical protein